MFAQLSLLWIALAGAPDLEWRAGVRSEGRGGVIPTGPDQPGVTAADIELVPSLRLGLSFDESRFAVAYGPRFARRFAISALPGGQEIPARFLILHNAEASYRQSFGARFVLSLSGTLARGESDYATLISAPVSGPRASSGSPAAVPDPNTAQAPSGGGGGGAASIIGVQSIGAGLVLDADLSSEQHMSLGARFADTRSIPTTGAVASPLLPSSRSIGAALDLRRLLSRTDAVTFGSALDFVKVSAPDGSADDSTAADYQNLALQLGWEHALEREATLGLRAGLAGVRTRGAFSFLPLANAALGVTPYESTGLRTRANLALGIQGFANPVLAEFQARYAAAAELSAFFVPDWRVAVSASFYTPTELSPDPSSMAGAALLGETLLSLALPVTYRLDDGLLLEAGARYSALGPRLRAPNFQFGNVNAIVYLAITAEVSSVL